MLGSVVCETESQVLERGIEWSNICAGDKKEPLGKSPHTCPEATEDSRDRGSWEGGGAFREALLQNCFEVVRCHSMASYQFITYLLFFIPRIEIRS